MMIFICKSIPIIQISELENANKNLNTELSSLREKLNDVKKSRDEEKTRGDGLDDEVGNLRRTNQGLTTENELLKAEVQKNVEEIAGALGDGYNCCLERVSGIGFDATGHKFEDYIRDFAASHSSEVQNPGNEDN